MTAFMTSSMAGLVMASHTFTLLERTTGWTRRNFTTPPQEPFTVCCSEVTKPASTLMGIMNPCIAACGRGRGKTVAVFALVFISERSATGSADWVNLPVRLNEGPLQAGCKPGEYGVKPREEIPRKIGNFPTQGIAASDKTPEDFAVAGRLRDP